MSFENCACLISKKRNKDCALLFIWHTSFCLYLLYIDLICFISAMALAIAHYIFFVFSSLLSVCCLFFIPLSDPLLQIDDTSSTTCGPHIPMTLSAFCPRWKTALIRCRFSSSPTEASPSIFVQPQSKKGRSAIRLKVWKGFQAEKVIYHPKDTPIPICCHQYCLPPKLNPHQLYLLPAQFCIKPTHGPHLCRNLTANFETSKFR